MDQAPYAIDKNAQDPANDQYDSYKIKKTAHDICF